MIVPLLFHVIINWDQTLRILSRFAEIVRATPKVNIVVDAALFVAAVTVMLSGLLISQYVVRAVGLTIMPTVPVGHHAPLVGRRDHAAAARPLRAALALDRQGRPASSGARGATTADDPILAIRVATRRLERAPRGEQYATAPVTTDARSRP